MSRGIFNYMRMLRALLSLTLNISRHGASNTSQGNLSQCFNTLAVKKNSLISNLNQPLWKPPYNSKTWPHKPHTHTQFSHLCVSSSEKGAWLLGKKKGLLHIPLGLTPTIYILHIKQLCNTLHPTASTAITGLMKLSIALYHVLIFRKLCKF